MDFTNLLKPAHVRCDVAARSRKHVLDLVSEQLAAASGGAVSAAEVFDALVSRERLGCTALGGGVAMPHGRVAGLSAPVGVFLRLREAVDFDTGEDQPVDLVFGLLVPEEAPPGCAAALGDLAERFRRSEFRRQVREARDARAVHALLTALRSSDAAVNA